RRLHRQPSLHQHRQRYRQWKLPIRHIHTVWRRLLPIRSNLQRRFQQQTIHQRMRRNRRDTSRTSREPHHHHTGHSINAHTERSHHFCLRHRHPIIRFWNPTRNHHLQRLQRQHRLLGLATLHQHSQRQR